MGLFGVIFILIFILNAVGVDGMHWWMLWIPILLSPMTWLFIIVLIDKITKWSKN